MHVGTTGLFLSGCKIWNRSSRLENNMDQAKWATTVYMNCLLFMNLNNEVQYQLMWTPSLLRCSMLKSKFKTYTILFVLCTCVYNSSHRCLNWFTVIDRKSGVKYYYASICVHWYNCFYYQFVILVWLFSSFQPNKTFTHTLTFYNFIILPTSFVFWCNLWEVSTVKPCKRKHGH